jgi:lysozyme
VQGIDLYQEYNLVTDWHRVAAAGISDVYVKLSDGGGPARIRGDAYVAGARAAGCQVGGYHYLEPSPSPETQADVFAAELRRLGALDLAPALDIEENRIPPAVRIDYGRRFLLHLQSVLNISRVAVYSSASWFTALHPDTWGIPGLVDWVAAYGVNDGREHPIVGYAGHVDAHQYTSTGHVPGIVGPVDLDTISGNVSVKAAIVVTANTPDDDQILATLIGSNRVVMPDGQPRNMMDCHYDTAQRLIALAASIAALTAAVAALASKTGVTKDELVAIVNDAVAHHLNITGTLAVTGNPSATT